jgi:cell wall-associated NlpC family hydrolase
MMAADQRAAVVAEARSWIGCRYHPMAAVKIERDASGAITERGGVDCATLLNEVYARAGVIERATIPHYPPDWHQHRKTERYLDTVLEFATEIDEARVLPGDVVLFKSGLVYSHGCIVTDPGWPAMIHAFYRAGTVQEDVGTGGEWGALPRKFFTLWQG